MSGFDPAALSFVRETIEDLGEGGYQELSPGTYHVKVNGDSEVATYNGFPVMRIQLTATEGPSEGISHSEFLRWFAPETSERSTKSHTDRQDITRRMTREWGRDFLFRGLDQTEVDEDRAMAIDEGFNALASVTGDTSEDMVEAQAVMEGLVDLMQGCDIYIKGKLKKGRDGYDDSVRYTILDYGEGVDKVEAAEAVEKIVV